MVEWPLAVGNIDGMFYDDAFSMPNNIPFGFENAYPDTPNVQFWDNEEGCMFTVEPPEPPEPDVFHGWSPCGSNITIESATFICNPESTSLGCTGYNIPEDQQGPLQAEFYELFGSPSPGETIQVAGYQDGTFCLTYLGIQMNLRYLLM